MIYVAILFVIYFSLLFFTEGPPVEYNGRNRFSGQSAAPQLGEDTVGVLKNLLNMSDENISSLLRQNVVQQCIVADE